MRLYASNASTARSARHGARLNRPFRSIDIANPDTRPKETEVSVPSPRPAAPRRALAARSA